MSCDLLHHSVYITGHTNFPGTTSIMFVKLLTLPYANENKPRNSNVLFITFVLNYLLQLFSPPF